MSKRKRDEYIEETHPIIKQIKYEHHIESKKSKNRKLILTGC